MIRETAEYRAIRDFYGDRVAERSQVPLINHIHEGLSVLDYLGATNATKKAWCLHPLFQADADILNAGIKFLAYNSNHHPWTIVLVMEYRSQANAWLSDKVGVFGQDPRVLSWKGEPTAGPIEEVKHMLIADKVQNYKDFWEYHINSHPRAAELAKYFLTWFKVLGIDNDYYMRLVNKIEEDKK